MQRTVKCPNCVADMRFDADSGMCVCDYCGASFNMSEISMETINEIKEDGKELYETKDQSHNISQEPEDVTVDTKLNEENTEYSDPDNGFSAIKHICASCGAEILTDEVTSTPFCIYCGSQNFITERIDNALRPTAVIPFKYGKEAAIEKFFAWCGGGKYTPFGFCSKKNVEKITGLYVPYWLYDMDCSMDLEAEVYCEDIKVHGNTQTVTTSTFKAEMLRNMSWNNISYDASQKMANDLMDAIEPYDFKEMVPFDEKYLLGFCSDMYDVPSESFREKIKNDVHTDMLNTYASETPKNFTGYKSYRLKNDKSSIRRFDAKYALLPVWILNYKYLGNTYTFLMNGQTGETTGHYPISKLKKIIKAAMWFLIFALIAKLLLGIYLGGIAG